MTQQEYDTLTEGRRVFYVGDDDTPPRLFAGVIRPLEKPNSYGQTWGVYDPEIETDDSDTLDWSLTEAGAWALAEARLADRLRAVAEARLADRLRAVTTARLANRSGWADAANDLLNEIDRLARDVSLYDYGLPLNPEDRAPLVRAVVAFADRVARAAVEHPDA